VLRELAEGVHVEDKYEGGNVGVILAERGALLIDTPMLPPDSRQWRSELEALGADAIYGIVNTDYHPENTLGNSAFAPVRTFGHELAARPISKLKTRGLEELGNRFRQRDAALADEIAGTELLLPEICVDDQVTLYLGDREVVVLYLEGHTAASLGVYLAQEDLLFAGETVTNGEEPVMYEANTLAWIGTLQRLKSMGVGRIVPGSGAVCGPEVVDPMIAHITEMRARVEDLFRNGASRRECVDKLRIRERFPVREDVPTRVRRRRRANIERVYTEVRISQRKS